MRKSWVIYGLTLAIVGIVTGFYGSQRNCLIAFVTRGHLNFWTAMEILGGFIAFVGIMITIVAFIRKQ